MNRITSEFYLRVTMVLLFNLATLTAMSKVTIAGSGAGACTALTPPASTLVTSTTNLTPSNNIQASINAASAGTLLSLTPGIYNVSSMINLKSGVSLQCQCGAALKNTGPFEMFRGYGVSNVTISNCVLDGSNTGSAAFPGAVYLDGYSSNIHIANNTLQNWTTANDFWLWDTQQTYIQDNLLTNGYQGVTWRTNPGDVSMDTLVVSDNIINGMSRMGIETGLYSVVTNFHIDRNTLYDIDNTGISFVGTVASGTLFGNISYSTIELGAGIGVFHVSAESNVISNTTWGFSISRAIGAAFLNNNFIGVANPFSPDGGYNNTEWIGSNTVNGVSQIGWPGHSYGATQPQLYSPSMQP